MSEPHILPSSFRDPSGFLFSRDGILYRQVDRSFAEDFDRLAASGLYAALTGAGLLIPHEDADRALAPIPDRAYAVIRPELVPFVSYPYEWSFGQLRDAALATLRIQKVALDHGMTLRDAGAYNIQFLGGRPVLIDTLSFGTLEEGKPWVAYRQFCQHFLAPLALMAHRDVRLGQLLRIHIDGIPLDLASALLPRRSKLRAGLLMHVHMHAKSQKRHAAAGERGKPARQPRPFGMRAFRGLIESLESAVRAQKQKAADSVWESYYAETHNYTDEALEHKKALVAKLVEEVQPATLWDLGGNTGLFGRIAAGKGVFTVCFDFDPAAVEANYRQVVARGETNLLPLVLDLTNPSGGIGWDNDERQSLTGRGPADCALALALVHHLAISNNVPLDRIASYFRRLCRWLVIEFVPKSDSKVRTLLATREDVFPGYTQDGFEHAFGQHFAVERREPVHGSERLLYLMRGK